MEDSLLDYVCNTKFTKLCKSETRAKEARVSNIKANRILLDCICNAIITKLCKSIL